MNPFRPILKPVLAAFSIIFTCMSSGIADDAPESFFDALAAADAETAGTIADDIREHWSRSGSATMDLLLERGKRAMTDGDMRAAVEHLTALTDHAPGFAEGWHARAKAFFASGLPGPALADIERTLALEPRHFDAMVGLATILNRTGAPEDALPVLLIARDIYPHHPEIESAMERLEAQLPGRDI